MFVIIRAVVDDRGTILAQGGGKDGTTAWLGISIDDTGDGVVVKRVSTGSPAEEGGLLVDDVIVSVDDQTIESSDALAELIQAHEPGDVISITIKRDDSEQTLEVELGSSSGRQSRDDITGDMDPLVMAERVLRVELDAVDEGYQVLAGRGHSEETLSVGDIITAVNTTPVSEIDWQTLLTELADQDDPVLTLTVLRDSEEITVVMEQFGGIRERGPMGEHGRSDHDNSGHSDQFGGPEGQSSQNGNAPHSVEPDATCDQCHSSTRTLFQPCRCDRRI
jgi:PDZ domain-containing secreted protein